LLRNDSPTPQLHDTSSCSSYQGPDHGTAPEQDEERAQGGEEGEDEAGREDDGGVEDIADGEGYREEDVLDKG
jgi:hypothetical protein